MDTEDKSAVVIKSSEKFVVLAGRANKRVI